MRLRRDSLPSRRSSVTEEIRPARTDNATRIRSGQRVSISFQSTSSAANSESMCSYRCVREGR
jgi:hypothetical protein